MPGNGKHNLSVFWTPSTILIISIVAVLVVHVASVFALVGALDVTQSNVRVVCIVASVLLAIFFVVVVIYRHSQMRRNYLEGYVSDYPDEIEYVGAWSGTLLFISLTIVLAVLHFRHTAPDAFNTLVNPGTAMILAVVIGAYYMASLLWLIVGVFIHFTAKGAEERRRFVDPD